MIKPVIWGAALAAAVGGCGLVDPKNEQVVRWDAESYAVLLSSDSSTVTSIPTARVTLYRGSDLFFNPVPMAYAVDVDCSASTTGPGLVKPTVATTTAAPESRESVDFSPSLLPCQRTAAGTLKTYYRRGTFHITASASVGGPSATATVIVR